MVSEVARYGRRGRLPRRTGSVTLALALAVASFAPQLISAQVVAGLNGTVSDSATGSPLVGVLVTVKDANDAAVTALQTSTKGAFAFVSPRGGVYAFELRKLGYRPIRSGAITLAPGPVTTLAIRMSVAVSALDTVLVQAASRLDLFGLTPKREVYRLHMLEHKGQFVTGLEIQRSHLLVSEYLATLPGIRFTDVTPMHTLTVVDPKTHNKSHVTIPSLIGIPGANYHSLVSAASSRCLVGRVDRFFIPTLMSQQSAQNIDQLFKVEDITGVELYIVQRDMPAEWRQWAFPEHVFQAPDTLYHILMADDRLMPPVKQANFLDNPPSDAWPCGFVQIWTRVAW